MNNYKYFTPEEKEERLKRLSSLEYEVTQKNAKETQGTGKYNDFHEEGIYVDIVSGEPLFTSLDKFDSGRGWPSFTKTIGDDAVDENKDTSYGMVRTELKSKIAKSHLGHFIGWEGFLYKKFLILVFSVFILISLSTVYAAK